MNQPLEFITFLFPGKSDYDPSCLAPLKELSELCDGRGLPEGAVGFRIVTCSDGLRYFSPRYFVHARSISVNDAVLTDSQRDAMKSNGLKHAIYTLANRVYAPQESDVILSN